MGYSTVAAEAIFFIVVILAAVTLASIFNNYFDSVRDSVSSQTKLAEQKINTAMTISDVVSTASDLNATARNTGETILDVNRIDVFIDGAFVDRANADISVIPSTDTKNLGLWDPYERILISLTALNIDSNTTYELKIESANGITATRKFTTS